MERYLAVRLLSIENILANVFQSWCHLSRIFTLVVGWPSILNPIIPIFFQLYCCSPQFTWNLLNFLCQLVTSELNMIDYFLCRLDSLGNFTFESKIQGKEDRFRMLLSKLFQEYFEDFDKIGLSFWFRKLSNHLRNYVDPALHWDTLVFLLKNVKDSFIFTVFAKQREELQIPL